MKKIMSYITSGTESGLLRLKELKQQVMIIGIVFLMIIGVVINVYVLKEMGLLTPSIKAEYDKNIAIITIDKMITDPYINNIIEKLEYIRVNKEEFPNLLIIMASGGGSPTGSSELAHYLIDLQKEINVHLYVESIAASGAMYISSAIKHNEKDPLSGIIASDNAILGSIGVIMNHMMYFEAGDKLGIKSKSITVGKWKEPISPWSPLSEAGENYLKNQLMLPVYNNFIKFVAKNRGMELDELKTMAEGKVYIASEVVGTLCDRISYLTQIKREIKESVEKRFPEQEVGFIGINLKRSKSSLFNVNFNIENLSVGTDLGENLNLNSNQYQMR